MVRAIREVGGGFQGRARGSVDRVVKTKVGNFGIELSDWTTFQEDYTLLG